MKAHVTVVLVALAFVVPTVSAQYGTGDGEWRHHGGDRGQTKYSPLDQIDATNFAQLEVVWKWESADSRLPEEAYEVGHLRGTPLKVRDRLYMPTGHGQVAALDAGTGEELWLHDPRSWERPRPTIVPILVRGLEYWTDGDEERIYVATPGRQLVALDPETGTPVRTFGEDGVVELSQDLGTTDFPMRNLSNGAPVIIVGDTIVVGSKIFDYVTRRKNAPGHIRGYDVKTGEFRWRFHTIPQEGEPFTETWENESWRWQGNTNAWSMMSADEELGYVYIPLSTPTNDYYGGQRHGDNVYAESLLCLDAATGKRVWHFQTVHHGIWDYDIASAPNLIDIVVGGRLIRAVAQVSKTGMTYVFDRKTGEPVWPIVERSVPSESSVPGEKLSPTQPFPTKPPPFERLGVTEDDLIDFTPELRAEAIEIAKQFVLGPVFSPLILKGHEGKRATLVLPGAAGGANWPGASIDPETSYLYVESQTRPTAMSLVEPDPARSNLRYVIDYADSRGPRGLPLLKPPYRRITAIDLRTGEHAWQVPVGDGPKDHPAIRHLNLGPLGTPYPRTPAEGGLLVTKTLLIGFVNKVEELGGPPRGALLRAYDKATGAVLAEVEVERSLHGSPMTYLHEGNQFIAVAGGGSGVVGGDGEEISELVVFALPKG